MPKTTSQRIGSNYNTIDGIILPASLKEEYAIKYIQSAIETLRESVSNLQEISNTHLISIKEETSIANVLYDRTEILGWHLMHRSNELKKQDDKNYGRMIDSVTDIHTNLAKIMFKRIKYTPSELAEKTRKEYFELHPDGYEEDAA
jgi:hypothetical protein